MNGGVRPGQWIIEPSETHGQFTTESFVRGFPSLAGDGLVDTQGPVCRQLRIIRPQREIMAGALMIDLHRKLPGGFHIKSHGVFPMDQPLVPKVPVESASAQWHRLPGRKAGGHTSPVASDAGVLPALADDGSIKLTGLRRGLSAMAGRQRKRLP